MKTLPNIHPGEVLLEEFLTAGHRPERAGACCRRTAATHQRIVPGKCSVSADSAIRPAAALGTSERLWLGLQADYDLEQARRGLGAQTRKIERIAA